MKSRTVKFIAVGVVAAVLTLVICSTAQTNSPSTNKAANKIAELFGDETLAKGEKLDIKRSQLDAAMISIKANNAARGQNLTPEQSSLMELQILERLIQINLLVNKATEADHAKGKEISAKQYETILQRAGSEEALVRQLKSVGMTMEELRSKMVEEATAQAVADRELNVNVTDEEVKKYYEDNPAKFEEPEMAHVSHILLTTFDPENQRAPLPEEKKQAKRKMAEDLLKRARGGEDFAKLAKEFSEDPGSRDKGGEYKFPRASADPRRAMVPEFESAAFALTNNQISDVITTQFGYHIIKLIGKIPAHKYALTELADGKTVNEQVKDALKREKLEKILPAYIEKMEKDAKVEIVDEKLKKIAATLEARKAAQPESKPVETKPEPKK